jgi:hypothetical protein
MDKIIEETEYSILHLSTVSLPKNTTATTKVYL